MANVDIARSSVPTVASFQLPSSLAHQQPLIISHALSVVETCSLLFQLYDLTYQSLCHIQASSAMSSRSSLSSSPPNSGVPHNIRQRAPPQPDPEPAAPPIIILAQSGNKPSVKPRPQFQVPAPAEQGLGPRQPTSSLSQRQTSRYNLRSRPSEPTFVSAPNKPTPQPEPHPAPPVIILSNEQPQPRLPQQPGQPHPSNPATPLPQTPTPQPSTPHNPLKRTHSTMGSKVSKVRERAHDGKLQPSQEQLDKEQMKEPSNYYTHRSKSMRRKAGKSGDAGGSGATAGAGSGGL